MTTFAEGRTELLARGFDGLKPARASRCLNVGLRRVCSAGLWPFTEFEFVSASPLALPGARIIRKVSRLGTSTAPLTHRQGDLPGELPPGTAREWFWDGQHALLRTYPYESALQLVVDTYRWHPWLTQDDDELIIPDEWLGVALDAACIEASKDLREWESVAGFKAEMADGLAEMAESLLHSQITSWDVILPVGC